MATGILPEDAAVFFVPLVTLTLGLLIGYLAQRSGYCSIGGFRDYFLFRHTRLLSGYLALIVASFAGYFLFWLVVPGAMEHFFWATTRGPFVPVPGAPGGLVPTAYLIISIVTGFLVGLIAVLLGGCPIRLTVMASEGNYRAAWFFVGMCAGSIIFATIVSGWVVWFINALGFGA